ncbi:NUDIX hydrolase [Actinotalea subterranea]|uniref:NUDIX hydrolase n=1 Tax=Actinotalea subterranea TaxID=2607497 RepID=UPI0011EC7608|nr:NUDIX domain-containing protein [Actinotalea subterranea]
MPLPDFVTRLRAGVGHELLWLAGVSAVVVADDGRLLLGRRSDTGRWAVVSGILDPGEQPAVAAAREVLEETGVSVEVVALTAVESGDLVRYPNGDLAQYLDVCFWARPAAGSAQAYVADDESLEVGWFAPDALPADLTSSSIGRIERTMRYIREVSGDGARGLDATSHRGVQPWFVRP